MAGKNKIFSTGRVAGATKRTMLNCSSMQRIKNEVVGLPFQKWHHVLVVLIAIKWYTVYQF